MLKLILTSLISLQSIIFINAQDFQQTSFQNSSINDFALADFNQDGYVDVLGVNSFFNFNSSIYLFKNLQTDPPSFEEMTIFENMDLFIDDIETGDLDGDNDIDFVLVNGSGELIMYQNQGDTIFNPISLNVNGAKEIEVSDLEGDGDLDIVGIDKANSLLRVYRNNGLATFTRSTLSNVADDIETFDIGDVDDDGDQDILVGSNSFFGEQVILMKNNGLNIFDKAVIAEDDFRGIYQIRFMDVNADGHQDLCGLWTSSIDCWMGDGGATYNLKTIISSNLSYPSGFRGFATADYNGDSKIDICVGNNDVSGNGGIRWHKTLSTDSLTFEEGVIGSVVTARSYAHADFDMDGDIDLLTTNGDVWLFLNAIEQDPVATFNTKADQVRIFPNPFTDFIQIDGISVERPRFQLLNMSGFVIQEGVLQTESLDMYNVPSGMYMIRLWNEENHELTARHILYKK